MAWRGVEITLAVDNWDIVCGAMSWGWAGWGAERAHGICAPFPLFFFENGRNGNCEIVSREWERKSSQSGRRGVPSHKRARLHNNVKREDLLLKLKVCIIYTRGILKPLL